MMTKIAALGPRGTFSHEAALKFNGLNFNGKDGKAELFFKNTVWDIFESVGRDAEIGIAPMENSVSGTVGLTLDALLNFNLSITAELILPIRHHLASYGSFSTIKVLYTNQQTYEQCEKFIRKALPNAELIETSSNATSAKKIAMAKDKTKAAITSELAAELYHVPLLGKGIQDNKFNCTKFVAIGGKIPPPTGKDRTSIAVYPLESGASNKPGLLYKLLGEFAKRKINLTKIESRPSKGKLGNYTFFIDLEGHQDTANIKSAFRAIRNSFYLKVLGSCPRVY